MSRSRLFRFAWILGIVALGSRPAGGTGLPPATLAVEDPAPPLLVSKWLRGTPVTRFEPGRTYVVESWATWCEPCIASMPRLTAIQQRHDGALTVIGVDIWESEPAKVPAFVDRMSDRMRYAVAMDSVPLGKDGFAGLFAKRWIEGAHMYSHGLPLAYVVSPAGRIAWVGHPSDLDSVVDAVVAGSWNLEAARARWKDDRAAEAKSEPLLVSYYGAMRANDPAAKIAACESLVTLDPERYAQYALTAFQTARGEMGDSAGAEKLAQRLRRQHAGHPATLLALARGVLLDPPLRSDPVKLRFALDCATSANNLPGGPRLEALRVMAACHQRLGDTESAIRELEGAEALAVGEEKSRIGQALAELRQTASKH